MGDASIDIVGFADSESSKPSSADNQKKKQKSGGFQSMGLSFPVIKGVLKRGYKVPTPIQRKTVPVALEGRDIVAMARTGSGKTACFLLPMFEKLKEHSSSGARALILSPTRELALQTLKFIKEIGRFTTLRAVPILGGDPMESQFSMIHGNPDIVVATPGRFLHICVEMQLKLSSVDYVVFDEADRLFEMGFSEQLTEILHRLPETRQTVLFSATLPKVLVQFAKAGLNDPVLIRLDVDTKIPDTLELSFYHCRPEERDAALLCILKHAVTSDGMTLVFAATKHHVEFVHMMLEHAGITSTYIYSDLDPSARKINTAKFQNGKVKVLVVTDVAARGIDIPQLDYVINYNFPAKPKLFVHRVGRCARAGRKGHAFNLVTTEEICYLLDLHLFLGRPLNMVTADSKKNSSTDCCLGKIPQSLVEEEVSTLMNWNDINADVQSMQKVRDNGYKNYIRSRPGASKDSVRRAKSIDVEKLQVHPIFSKKYGSETERLKFINEMRNYKPDITIFELGQSSNSIMSLSTRLFRKINKENVDNFHRKKKEQNDKDIIKIKEKPSSTLEGSNANDIEDTFQEVITSRRKRRLNKQEDSSDTNKKSKVDLEHYIPYQPSDEVTEKGLAVDNMQVKSNDAMLDMTGDTADMMKSQKKVDKKWDSTKKKYIAVNNREKMIKSESGQWIPVSYKTDRYAKWQEKSKVHNVENSDNEEETVKPLPGFSMRLDTHWGRHNLKEHEKQQKKLINIDTKHILKMRKLKEKRRLRNGRKGSKTKVMKKSAKFNKI